MGYLMPKNILDNPQAIVDLYKFQGPGDRCVGDWRSDDLRENFGINIDDKATRDRVTKALEGAGFSYYYMDEKQRAEADKESTALFAYNKDRLQELLKKNEAMLDKAGWPKQADKFVKYLSYVAAPVNSEIWDFIARCHDDKFNHGLQKNSYTLTTAAEIEVWNEHAEATKRRFKELHPDFFKDDVAPAVNNNASAPPVRPSGDGLSAGEKGTNLYKFLVQSWGGENIEGRIFSQMFSFSHPTKFFPQQTKNGFKIELFGGHSIEWHAAQKRGRNSHESISGDKTHFDQEQASAIVTMARVHGWQSIDVQGSKEHKEMLWLATQRQALHERDMQLAGKMPEGPLPHVANFKPAEDSAIYKQWLEEKAGWEKAHSGEKFDNTPAPKADSAGSAQTPAIKEARTPREKILRAFGQKLRTQFTKHAARKPAVAPQSDAAPVKPAGTRSRFHRRPDGKQKPGA
jgi:hypothetical protein